MKVNLTMFIISAALFITGCGGAEGTSINETGTSASGDSDSSPKKGLSFTVGEEVKLGDFVIKVNKVQPYKSTDEYLQPDKDKQLLAVEVEYSNPTSDKQLNSNPFNWSASDSEGYSYEYEPMFAKEPMLNATTINPGGKTKGWITFQIPKTNKLSKLQFKPGFFDNTNIEFTIN